MDYGKTYVTDSGNCGKALPSTAIAVITLALGIGAKYRHLQR